MESVKNAAEKILCHDCKKHILKGLTLFYENNREKIKIYKCESCYEKNPGLKNFQKCEVYSRIVGYIRPIQQWHKGKQQEFSERTEFRCSSC
jgi:anaerobic ribonucleoside-triphosphate reductase